MPRRNPTQLNSDIDADIVSNTPLAITPAKVRTLLKNFAESVFNKEIDRVSINVDSVAALRALTDIPAGIKHITLLGYYAPGDQGGGTLRIDSADTTTADNNGFCFVTAGGVRVKRYLTDRVNVMQFGARGDNTTDDFAAIQAAIDYAIANKIIWLYFPVGRYRVSDTLKVGRGIVGTATDFSTLHIMGAGKWNLATGVCRLVPTFTDRPVINFQGARYSSIEYVSIQGLNTAPGTLITANQHLSTRAVSSWVSAGCSNGRYNPYCAISIDAYSGTKPGSDFYPNDDYGRLTSSGIRIANCDISGFVVGIMNSPSTLDSNAEDTEIERVSVSDCTWGVSFGASQNRNCNIRNASLVRSFCGITSFRHGVQNANFPICNGLDMGVSYRLFEVYVSGGATSINDCHAEAFTEIGMLGNGQTSVATPLHIKGGQFQRLQSSGIFAGCFLPVVFDSCSFTSNGDLVFGFGADALFGKAFKNCTFAGVNPFFASNQGTQHQLRFDNSFLTETGTGELVEMSENAFVATMPTRLTVMGYTRTITTAVGRRFAVRGMDMLFTINVTSTDAAQNVTFTWFDASGDGFYRVGDFISWVINVETSAGVQGKYRLPAYRITSVNIANKTFVATAIVNLGVLDTANDRFPFMYRKSFVNATQATGDTTSGSTSITNVTNIANFLVGDHIQGTGIPALCRITAISGTTLTVTNPPTASATGVAISGSVLTPLN